MNHHVKRATTIAFIIAAGVACAAVTGGRMTFEDWKPLFDGKTLEGWTISDSNGHGDTQAWEVLDGAIVGMQDKPGNGGIIYTNETYGDFLLELELNPDWGLDSGIFLRSTPGGQCYQIMVDNYDGGDIGGIYGEGTGGFYAPTGKMNEVVRKGEWNRLLTMVTNNPPKIDVWLNGHHVTSWQGEEKLLEDEGHIALQVHAGAKYEGLKTRYRNIRIRELD